VVKTADKLGKGKDVDAREVNFSNLGMTVRNLTNEEMEKYDVKSGVMVSDVKEYGKAFNQRISKNYVIVSVDRKEVGSASELQSMLDSKKGKAVLIKIVDTQGNSSLIGLDIPK
jgi:serine protease Do